MVSLLKELERLSEDIGARQRQIARRGSALLNASVPSCARTWSPVTTHGDWHHPPGDGGHHLDA
ncbi:hypothetical protein [Corallococcus sp. 4LFB]|uniref:hypothetical protein n=1 Tax=Corallococcus sp. 4LFB TaxID=3383249 RepID=UPI0039754C48